MITMIRLPALVIFLAALAACAERESPTPPTPPAPEAIAPVDTPAAAEQSVTSTAPVVAPPKPVGDTWLGEWRGPEGTALRLSATGDAYRIAITNLDGERTFHGTAGVNEISFERDGVVEIIRAGNGIDTGMKWLVDKHDCLIVRSGEGYCRD